MCKDTCPRTRTRPSDWGVAPVPVSAARAALTDPAAKAQDVAVSWPYIESTRAHRRRAKVRIGPPRRLHTPVRP